MLDGSCELIVELLALRLEGQSSIKRHVVASASLDILDVALTCEAWCIACRLLCGSANPGFL